MKNQLLAKIDKDQIKPNAKNFSIGDTVKVMQRVVEGNKTRSQAYEGVVIAVKGSGVQQNFTVRRISFGVGVEKTFPLSSPNVQSVSVTRKGQARRAKLYYLREKSGKEGRLKESQDTAVAQEE